jgi:hypothetical protein
MEKWQALSAGREPLRVLRRRGQFLIRYVSAKRRQSVVHKLVPILERFFDHAWVAGVELKIRAMPGNESSFARFWRIYQSLPAQLMHWDAPITISIYRKQRGKLRQALCMSLYISEDMLYIAQMQGVAKTDVPAELRAWPKIFIDCCKTFARQEGFRGVGIPKAGTLYSYQRPFIRKDLSSDARVRALQRIRRDMATIYDSNALDLGFNAEGGYWVWSTPRAFTADDYRKYSAIGPIF